MNTTTTATFTLFEQLLLKTNKPLKNRASNKLSDGSDVIFDGLNDFIPSIITINNVAYTINDSITLTLKKNWYTGTIVTNEPWAHVNSTDALIVMKQFVAIIQLSELKLICADVSGNGTINSLDAMMIAKRYTQLINSFSTGNWKFDDVIINGPNITIHGRCVGDVN